MIYLDTSALVKLVVREDETDALVDWLNDTTGHGWGGTPAAGRRQVRRDCCTAQVGSIELMRAALRFDDVTDAVGDDAVVAARRLLDKVDTLLMSEEVADVAKSIGPAQLRTLDALHLATVLVNRSIVTAVCVYDRRLASAFLANGLTTVAPGADSPVTD